MTSHDYVEFILNGQTVCLETDPRKPLLRLLRDDLDLTGTKQGCDMEGECGACTVIVDGEAVRSCLLPVAKVAGRSVTTVEGLGTPDHPHPLQIAFLEAGAVQCGYCTPGMLLAAKALLDRTPQPGRAQIVNALEGNICRCTGYVKIIEAVERAAAQPTKDQRPTTNDQRREGTKGTEGGTDVPSDPFGPFAPSDPFPSFVVRRSSLIGGDLGRHRGWERVSGATRYAEDIKMPGMHYLHVVRSPHFHAWLIHLDPTPALAVPGVVRVLTAQDIPGENSLGGYSVGEHLLAAVGDTVRMIGDPVALVIGVSPEAAAAGAQAVHVEYEVLPHTTEIIHALEPGARPIHPGGNLLASEAVHTGDITAALARSDVVVETAYQTSFQAHMALEREAAVGYIYEEGRLTVICGSHEPHWNRGYLATILGLPLEQIRVITPPMGGSFGGKQDVWPMAATALAVYHLRQPVRLAYTRQEVMDATPKRHPYTCHCRVGATATGTLTGMSFDARINTGAYDSAGRYLADYAVTASVGPYRWPAVDAHAAVIYSNGPKAGQFRGFGTPQPVFAMECTLDELIEKLGVDPLGPVAALPFRARQTEAFLAGQLLNPETLLQAGEIARSECQPRSSPLRASREYRLALIPVMVRDSLAQAAERARSRIRS
jgi:xanthine dehydrogenase molybdenum-binding subunit